MVEPYINLKGQADNAIKFYEAVFGCTDKKIMRLSDMPQNPDYPVPDEMKNWIAHAQMTICGTMFNFSDMQPDTLVNGMISLLVRFNTVHELMEIYNKLMADGQALMAPEPQSYAKMFAWVRDKFGIDWQLICD